MGDDSNGALSERGTAKKGEEEEEDHSGVEEQWEDVDSSDGDTVRGYLLYSIFI